jgi:hypothetical protein
VRGKTESPLQDSVLERRRQATHRARPSPLVIDHGLKVESTESA